MPTGYTAPIADGISFRRFALSCARAFGACIEMRDDPAGPFEEPPAKEGPSYHAKSLAEARAKLRQLNAMTSEQVEDAAQKSHEEKVAAHEAERARRIKLRGQYEAMLAQVDAWVPPTKQHEPAKEFMRKQIEESIAFDCELWREEPAALTPDAWLEKEIEAAEWSLEYHAKEAEKERERNESRRAWRDAFRASLPPEPGRDDWRFYFSSEGMQPVPGMSRARAEAIMGPAPWAASVKEGGKK